jgi:hypothetical protein
MRWSLLVCLCLAAAAQDRDQLLNPAALEARPAETLDQIRQNFADPPAESRSMPLWVWNDEMDAGRLKEQLEQFKSRGIGGVFIHPRPGLMTEYLGPDWFKLWGQALEEGKRLGLSVNIYDENSYPSGFAGGHVPALAPDTAAQFVEAVMNADPARLNWAAAETVAVFSMTKAGAQRVATRA